MKNKIARTNPTRQPQMKHAKTTKSTRARKTTQSAKGKPDAIASTFKELGLPQPKSFEIETTATLAEMTNQVLALAKIADSLATAAKVADAKLELLRRENAGLREKIDRQDGKIELLEQIAMAGRGITKDELEDILVRCFDKGDAWATTVAGASLMGPQQNLPPNVREIVADGIGLNQHALG